MPSNLRRMDQEMRQTLNPARFQRCVPILVKESELLLENRLFLRVETIDDHLDIQQPAIPGADRARIICVVDPKTTTQNIRILKACGVEIDLVSEPDPVTREFL